MGFQIRICLHNNDTCSGMDRAAADREPLEKGSSLSLSILHCAFGALMFGSAFIAFPRAQSRLNGSGS